MSYTNVQHISPETLLRRQEELEKIISTYRLTVPKDPLNTVTIAFALEKIAGSLRREASENES